MNRHHNGARSGTAQKGAFLESACESILQRDARMTQLHAEEP